MSNLTDNILLDEDMPSLADEVEDIEGDEEEIDVESDEGEPGVVVISQPVEAADFSTITNAVKPPNSQPTEEAFTTSDPYDLAQCQVTFVVSLNPSDLEDGTRSAMVGIRSHADAPILKVIKSFQPDTLPEIFNELWKELETQMPFRKMEAAKRPKQMIGGSQVARPSTTSQSSHTPKPSMPPSPTTAGSDQLDLFSL